MPGSQIIGPITTATLPAGNLSGTIGTAQLADASVTAAKLASNSCTAGQILKYTGTQWACGADSNSGGTVTSIAAGTGLTGGTITTTGTIGLGTVPVANGGTGQTTLAANGLVYGQGTGGVGVTASGATGQVLVGTGGAPAWSGTPTITGVIASGGGVKFPDGNIQTKALANCSAEGDVAVMHSGTWVCRSTLGYVDNGDGTVTDNKTGLMWEQKATCGGVNLGNAQCKENTYTWSATSPFTDPSGTLYSDFLQKLNGLDFSGGSSCFAGYCDWRIPTVGELRSLLTAQYPAVCPSSPCINAVFAPTTQASFYWSSSSLASVPNGAWGVGFNFGDVGFNNKSSNNYARAVRSGR